MFIWNNHWKQEFSNISMLRSPNDDDFPYFYFIKCYMHKHPIIVFDKEKNKHDIIKKTCNLIN